MAYSRQELSKAQDEFAAWVRSGLPWPDPPNAEMLSASNEVMPDDLCDRLKINRGSPYSLGKAYATTATFALQGFKELLRLRPDGRPWTIDDCIAMVGFRRAAMRKPDGT